MLRTIKKISIATGCLILSVLLISSATTAAKPGRTWVKIKGQIYGAKPDERGPIGGGKGYRDVIRSGDFQARTVEELAAALEKAQTGQIVFVPGDVELDCTDLVFDEGFYIKIPAGVTLASDRGHRGSVGALIYCDKFGIEPLVYVQGPNVRITGLRLRGPDPKRRLEHHDRGKAGKGDVKRQREYYYRLPMSTGIKTESGNLEVDNCELSGWSITAISLDDGENHRIHHNFIHHNQLNGLGYGIAHGSETTTSSLIECNLFNFNRHSIAADGAPGTHYEARNNVELGVSLSHNFDMHGGRDREDGTDIAGDRILIHHNTFLGSGVRAVAIRGVPREEARIDHNWFAHLQPDEKLIGPWPLIPESRIVLENNAYGLKRPTVRNR